MRPKDTHDCQCPQLFDRPGRVVCRNLWHTCERSYSLDTCSGRDCHRGARPDRRSDFSGWQSATNIVLGIVLLVITLINWSFSISPLVTFWINLWVGLTVASLALWAALYHPKENATESA
jgi:hypothetical protein